LKKYVPQQGDIIKLDFNPSKGHEQKGYRPAVIVSNRLLNKNCPFLWVVPITHGQWEFPTHVALDKRTKTDGQVYVEQLLMIDCQQRTFSFVEKLPEDILEEILLDIQELSKRLTA